MLTTSSLSWVNVSFNKFQTGDPHFLLILWSLTACCSVMKACFLVSIDEVMSIMVHSAQPLSSLFETLKAEGHFCHQKYDKEVFCSKFNQNVISKSRANSLAASDLILFSNDFCFALVISFVFVLVCCVSCFIEVLLTYLLCMCISF